MKTICFFALLLSVLCFGCTQQTADPLESYSPDKQLKIVVSGNQSSDLDAWMTEIELTHAGKIDKVVQEFYADRMDRSTVSFEWKSDAECIIHFTQRDGTVIDVPVRVQL